MAARAFAISVVKVHRGETVYVKRREREKKEKQQKGRGKEREILE